MIFAIKSGRLGWGLISNVMLARRKWQDFSSCSRRSFASPHHQQSKLKHGLNLILKKVASHSYSSFLFYFLIYSRAFYVQVILLTMWNPRRGIRRFCTCLRRVELLSHIASWFPWRGLIFSWALESFYFIFYM